MFYNVKKAPLYSHPFTFHLLPNFYYIKKRLTAICNTLDTFRNSFI